MKRERGLQELENLLFEDEHIYPLSYHCPAANPYFIHALVCCGHLHTAHNQYCIFNGGRLYNGHSRMPGLIVGRNRICESRA